MTKEDAEKSLEYLAKAFERGIYVLSAELRDLLGEAYYESVREIVPLSIREAIQTLKDPDKKSHEAKEAGPE